MCQVIACQVFNISSIYMASNRVIAEYNQAELSKLEARTANNLVTKALGRVAGIIGLRCE